MRLVSWDAAPTRSGEEAASVCDNEGGGWLRERLMPLLPFRAAGRLHGALQHAGSREAGLHPQEGQAQRRHVLVQEAHHLRCPRATQPCREHLREPGYLDGNLLLSRSLPT